MSQEQPFIWKSSLGGPKKNAGGAYLGLHHSRNPRACAPRGQLQTMLEHHHPAPAQLINYGRWRLVVSGHSQSSQLTGLGKSHPLTCQQQSRLNYKRRVYLPYTKDASQVPSLGDRGGCATGPYRMPTTLGHTTKTKQLYLIHTNIPREAAKVRR